MLEEAGHDVWLTHPQKVKALAEATVKTDRVDSKALAQLLNARLPPSPTATSGCTLTPGLG
jgi:transposase